MLKNLDSHISITNTSVIQMRIFKDILISRKSRMWDIEIKKNYTEYWVVQRPWCHMWLSLMRLSLIGAQIRTRKSTYWGLDNEFVRGPKWRRLDILDSTKDTAIHACVRDHVTEKYALDESYKPPRCSDANFVLGRLIIPLEDEKDNRYKKKEEKIKR